VQVRSFEAARRAGLILAVVLGAVVLAFAAATSGADAKSKRGPRPVPLIFVHGQSGSVQQFESNAMRFDSNGFPKNRIFAYEYDTNESTNDVAIAGLDPFIDRVLSKTGARKVNILAHSRGTTVMHSFLSTPERAARVNRYVNFDGRSADSPPGGVPTLAVWGELFSGTGPDTREIVGAKNVRYPEKSHTEVTTSKQAFGDVYEFLLGRKPKTRNVVPEPPGQVTVAGRASLFPANTGMDDGTLKVFQVKAKTGQRKGRAIYRKELGPQGRFGPVKVNGRKHYEFVVTRPGKSTIHNYPEPFERDDHFYRVLSAPGLEPFLDTSPDHTNVAVTRMREFRGDQTGAGANDRLSFNGLNVINAAIAPRGRRVLAVFNLDRNSDRVTDTGTSLFPFNALSFLTGVDNYMPSSPDASGRIAVREVMRQPGGQTKTINVPNWPSSEHTVSVFFRDYAAKAYAKPRKCRKGKKGKKSRKCRKAGRSNTGS
jgi:hypothetical protein